MKDKRAETTLAAFMKIIADNGALFKEISCDMGNEFNLVEKYLQDKESVLRRKPPAQINAISVVDRFIGKLKVILSGRNLTDWASALKGAVRKLPPPKVTNTFMAHRR